MRLCTHSFILLGWLTLMAGGTVSAQIQLSTTLDHVVYLQFEPMIARTTVKTGIGQPVVFNSEPTGPNFYFRVNDDYGHQMPPLADAPRAEPTMVPAQATIGFTNNMLRLYNLARPGFYSIQPCVDWMGKTYQGEKRHIEVVSGREIMRITANVPADGSSRTYKIFHLNRRQQDHILLRIDDEESSLCYGVFPLGRSVMNEKPQMVVDATGNAHILFKNAPNRILHVTYSPFGSMIDQKIFGQEYSTISLGTKADGSVESIGQQGGPSAPKPVQSIINNR